MHECIIIIVRLSELYFYMWNVRIGMLFIAQIFVCASKTFQKRLSAASETVAMAIYLRIQQRNITMVFCFTKAVKQKKIFDFVYPILTWLFSFNFRVHDLSENIIQYTLRKLTYIMKQKIGDVTTVCFVIVHFSCSIGQYNTIIVMF